MAAVGKDGNFDRAAMHRGLLAVFRAYGIDVASLPIEVASDRVRSSPIRSALVAALDRWADDGPANVAGDRLSAIASAADGPANAPVRAMIVGGDFAGLRSRIASEEGRRAVGAALLAVVQALVRHDPIPSLPLLRQVQREHPSDFWYSLALAEVYRNAKPPRAEEATRYYSAAVALRPEGAAIHTNFAIVLQFKGDLDDAVAEHRRAIALRPDFGFAHMNLGVALNARGDLDGAVAAYRRATALRPDDALAHFNLGFALRAKGEIDAAVAEYRRAIVLRPDDAEAYTNLGLALRGGGDLDAAIAEPSPSGPTMPPRTTTSAWRSTPRPSSAGPSRSSPTTPRPTATSGRPCSNRLDSPRRSRAAGAATSWG